MTKSFCSYFQPKESEKKTFFKPLYYAPGYLIGIQYYFAYGGPLSGHIFKHSFQILSFGSLLSSWVAICAKIGTISVSLFGPKPSLTPLFKWMQRFGIRRTGRLMWTNLWLTAPESSLTNARPASLRSRSNQVFQMPPPYHSAPT